MKANKNLTILGEKQYTPRANYLKISLGVQIHQTVTIIRNKTTESTDMILSPFNAVLNFRAIISRLDFKYSDLLHFIEQQQSTLRQDNIRLL